MVVGEFVDVEQMEVIVQVVWVDTLGWELRSCSEYRNQVSCMKNGVGVDNRELWLPPGCHARLDYPHASVVVWGITNAVEPAYDGTRVQWTLK